MIFFAGTVTQNNIAMKDAIVQVWHRSSESLVATTTTAEDGSYRVEGLIAGDIYDLIAIDPNGVWERKISSSRYPVSA